MKWLGSVPGLQLIKVIETRRHYEYLVLDAVILRKFMSGTEEEVG